MSNTLTHKLEAKFKNKIMPNGKESIKIDLSYINAEDHKFKGQTNAVYT